MVDSRESQSPLPRRRQERSLVTSRHRSTEPTPIDHPGPRPQRHHLGWPKHSPKALQAPPIDCKTRNGGAISVSTSGSDFTNAATRLETPRPTNPLFRSLPGDVNPVLAG